MIYTIGYTLFYRREFALQGDQFTKRGRHAGYQGGSVWPTAREAWRYIAAETPRLDAYSVWEVDADWEKDTAPNANGAPFRDLLKDSRIVREVSRGEAFGPHVPDVHWGQGIQGAVERFVQDTKSEAVIVIAIKSLDNPTSADTIIAAASSTSRATARLRRISSRNLPPGFQPPEASTLEPEGSTIERGRFEKASRAMMRRKKKPLRTLFVTPHAVDRASLRCAHQWKQTRRPGEGIYTWLHRMAIEALRKRHMSESTIYHNGLKFAFAFDMNSSVLKTVMQDDRGRVKVTLTQGAESDGDHNHCDREADALADAAR